MKKLYLDDIRTPKTKGWIIVRSYNEFCRWITNNGVPEAISFDHDLSEDSVLDGKVYTGYDCAKWLCEYCMVNGIPLPEYNVHSANPVGASNIKQLLDNFKRKFE
jgi:hypothetical protein